MLPNMSTSPIPPGTGTPGDACPGALRLHAADDGFLARVRIPGGVLTVAQARALGELSGALGDGMLHLTSRGNLQLRGLRDGCGGELAGALGEAGLLPSPAHERVRNVVASPMSGLDDLGFVDVRDWLRELDAQVCASSVTPELSGRFLFALDDGRGDVAALGPDVLVRGLPGGEGLLSVGGAEFRVRYEDAARAAVIAAEVFVEAAREVSGRRVWRVAELAIPVAELTERLTRRLEISPARGAGLGSSAAPPRGATGHDGTAPDDAPSGFALPFGTATPAQWTDLTDRAAQLPAQEIRLTPWRRIVIPGIPGITGITGKAEGQASPWTRVGACIGRPGCAKSHTDVRADATARLAEAHPTLPTYWSGCERRCGHPAGTYVDITARPDGGYDINTRTNRPS